MAGDVAAKGRKRKRRCQPELSDEPPTDAAACPRKQKKHETSNRSGRDGPSGDAVAERGGAKTERIDAGTGFKDERLSTKGPTYRETCRACQEGDLYSSTATLKCLLAGCVPCAYKMVVQPSLPHEETESARFRANKRPGVMSACMGSKTMVCASSNDWFCARTQRSACACDFMQRVPTEPDRVPDQEKKGASWACIRVAATS